MCRQHCVYVISDFYYHFICLVAAAHVVVVVVVVAGAAVAPNKTNFNKIFNAFLVSLIKLIFDYILIIKVFFKCLLQWHVLRRV